MSFVTNSFTTKNRTSVVYDFSIVRKAAFYVVERIPVGMSNTFTYRPSDKLPNVLYVQINPSELKLNSGCRNLLEKVAMSGDAQAMFMRDFGNEESTLEIDLTYDMYDEHMIGTLDGMIAAAAENASLLSKTNLSLQRLVELSRSNNELVLFKWGPNEFFGTVESADFNYKAFSRFGYPLKATGKVTLKSEGDEWGGDGELKSGFDNKAMGILNQVKGSLAYKAETGLLTAEIGATKALR